MPQLDVKAEARTATICFGVATRSLEMARNACDEFDLRHHCLVGLVFVAFSFEAMLNHYGQILFSDWEDRSKQKVPRKDWHKEFFTEVNLRGYLGKHPYQTLDKFLNYRDSVAHGKTEEETYPININDDTGKERVLSEILFAPVGSEKIATFEALDAAIQALKLIQHDIESHGHYPGQESIRIEDREHLCESPLSFSGVRSWWT